MINTRLFRFFLFKELRDGLQYNFYSVIGTVGLYVFLFYMGFKGQGSYEFFVVVSWLVVIVQLFNTQHQRFSQDLQSNTLVLLYPYIRNLDDYCMARLWSYYSFHYLPMVVTLIAVSMVIDNLELSFYLYSLLILSLGGLVLLLGLSITNLLTLDEPHAFLFFVMSFSLLVPIVFLFMTTLMAFYNPLYFYFLVNVVVGGSLIACFLMYFALKLLINLHLHA